MKVKSPLSHLELKALLLASMLILKSMNICKAVFTSEVHSLG